MPAKSIFRGFALCLLVFVFFASAGTGAEEQGLSIEELPQIEADVQVFPQVQGGFNSAVFSPDGRYVVTGDSDGAVKIWEAETGMLRKSFYGHEKVVLSVAWSPDGKFIASGSWDNTIKIWAADIVSPEILEPLTFSHDKEVFSVAFSPDSRLLVSGSFDLTVRIWDVASGGEIKVLSGHGDTVQSAAFSPDGKCVASASSDRTVIIWDVETGTQIRTLTGHRAEVRSVAWSPDGRSLVSASFDMTVRIWDAATGDSRVIGNGVFTSFVCDAQFSPDGKRIVTAGGFLSGNDNDTVIWDAATGTEIWSFRGHAGTVASAGWNKEGNFIVTASYDNTAKVWDADNGNCISTFTGKTEILRQAGLSRDSRHLVTGSEGNKVNIWNAQTGVLERVVEHIGEVYTVAISPDGSLIAAGAVAWNDQIKIWDGETGREVRTFRGHSNAVLDLTFTPDGLYLASASADRTIIIWDIQTGSVVATLSGHTDTVSSVAFSADGRLLISGSLDGTVCIWESSQDQDGHYNPLQILTGHNAQVLSVAVSPDGKRVVSSSYDRTIRLWDLEMGHDETLKADIYLNGIWSLAFSPDNKYIIAGTANNQILRWEIEDDRTIRYKGAKDKLLGIPISLSYSSDGNRILAGMFDGTARLYNAGDLSEIAAFVYLTGTDAETRTAGRELSFDELEVISQIDGDWLTITPDGYYLGSIRADRFINVLINKRSLSTMDAYSDIFHKPEVVQARLLGQPDPIDTRLSIKQAAAFMPPTVRIESPLTGTTVTGQGSVTLSVSISDQNLPIKDIRILVNGVRIGSEELRAVKGTADIKVEEGGLSLSRNQKNVQFTVPITLVEPGSNRIEVMAYNGYAWGYSGNMRNVTVNWEPPAGMRVPLPDLWILAVGVNKYNDEDIPDLKFCENDARTLVESFKAQEGRRYGKVNIRLLVDGETEPTAANVRSNLSFLQQAGQRDVVLMFLAGHGISEGNRFYFLTKDAVIDSSKKVDPNRAITDEALKQVMDAPGRRMIFIDACQSGGMDIDGFMYSLRRTNAYMLSSSEGNKPSYEDASWDRHGVFTYSIIRGLDGRARPRSDASISVLQLSGYVRNTVMDLTLNKPYQQRPVQYSWGFSDFDIAR